MSESQPTPVQPAEPAQPAQPDLTVEQPTSPAPEVQPEQPPQAPPAPVQPAPVEKVDTQSPVHRPAPNVRSQDAAVPTDFQGNRFDTNTPRIEAQVVRPTTPESRPEVEVVRPPQNFEQKADAWFHQELSKLKAEFEALRSKVNL